MRVLIDWNLRTKENLEIASQSNFSSKSCPSTFFRRNSTRPYRFIKKTIVHHYRQTLYSIKKIFAISTFWRSVTGAQIDSDTSHWPSLLSTSSINFFFYLDLQFLFVFCYTPTRLCCDIFNLIILNKVLFEFSKLNSWSFEI